MRIRILFVCIAANCQGCASRVESPAPVPDPAAATIPAAQPMGNTPFIVPGIANPESFTVDQVSLPDDTPVIGVIHEDSRRAYLCLAMSSMMSHVVNDRLGDAPISVTYCDRTDCARVFRGADESALDVQTGGYVDGEMAVRIGGTMYPQSSKSIPLADQEFSRTTWGTWKSEHPGTTIFLGQQSQKFLKPAVQVPTSEN